MCLRPLASHLFAAATRPLYRQSAEKFVNIDAMASTFESLPPEMVQKCVEFLDFDLVSGDLKAVSKATRGVARRALTRGRWKPIRFVAAEGLAFCTPARPADDLLRTRTRTVLIPS